MSTSTSWTAADQRLAFLGLLHIEHPFLQELSFHSRCRPLLATHQPSSFDVRLHSAPPSSPPSLNPPSFLLCFPTFPSHLPRLSLNSSSAPPAGVCRLRRTQLTGSCWMGDGCGSCGDADAASPCHRRVGPRACASRWTLFEPLHRWLGSMSSIWD